MNSNEQNANEVSDQTEEQAATMLATTQEPTAVELDELPGVLEALLFVAGTPLTLQKLSAIVKVEEEIVKSALQNLKVAIEDRGQECSAPIELVEINDGYQLRTKDIYAPYIQELKKSKPKKLSAAALETLAVIAYRQPVVKSDIEAIRGVDVTPTLKTLLDRKLARIVGYQATVGQPALYGTTDYFLELFGLKSLTELPALKDLREFAEDPGEGGMSLGEDSDHDSGDDSTDNDLSDDDSSEESSHTTDSVSTH